jgi:hypothetical protein
MAAKFRPQDEAWQGSVVTEWEEASHLRDVLELPRRSRSTPDLAATLVRQTDQAQPVTTTGQHQASTINPAINCTLSRLSGSDSDGLDVKPYLWLFTVDLKSLGGNTVPVRHRLRTQPFKSIVYRLFFKYIVKFESLNRYLANT